MFRASCKTWTDPRHWSMHHVKAVMRITLIFPLLDVYHTLTDVTCLHHLINKHKDMTPRPHNFQRRSYDRHTGNPRNN